MKKFLLAIIVLFPQISLAGSGYLFNVAVNGSSLSITATANHTYPNAGIKITSPGFTLANPGTQCQLNANGYCLFSVSQTSPAMITVKGSGSLNVTLCLNGAGPMSCQNYTLPIAGGTTPVPIATGAYVTNDSGTPAISFCAINQSTGSLENCQDAGGETVLSAIAPQGIILNSTGANAYITGDTSTPYAYQCTINASGTFNTCTAVNITTPTGYNPIFGEITLNSTNTIAYIVDASNARVIYCPIVSGSLGGGCSDTNATANSIGTESSAIVLNRANTTAYIAGYSNNKVTVCNVTGSTSFGNCIQKTGGGAIVFGDPGGVALNNIESILYVTDYDNGNVYGCSTTPNGSGTFSNCFIATTGITFAWSIVLNAANTFAYITDYDTNVYACPINNDGTFGTCVANSGFPGNPVGIALRY